jgi:ATP-dependent DNA helicase DinG
MKFCPKCGVRIRQPVRRGETPGICHVCGYNLGDGPVPKARGLADHFPHGTMRPFQKEVLTQVEAALASSKRFIILEAPVGFGKSAIAASLCNYLGSSYLLTATKQLQDQYSLDFGFPVVMGKSNFTCLVPTSSGRHVACSKGRCEADWTLPECPHYLSFEEYDLHRRKRCTKDMKCERLKERKLCTYYEQKWDTFRSKVMVANYPFFMAELMYTDDVKRRKLLVCDEAHDLEKQIVASTSFSLTRFALQNYRTPDSRDVVALRDRGIEDATAWQEELHSSKDLLEAFIRTNLGSDSMQDRVASCKSSLDSLDAFIDDLQAHPSNWVVSSVRKVTTLDGEPSVEEVVFEPLEVGAYTSRLFGSAETVLLMSATVSSKEALCRALGIPEESTAFIKVKESSFPVENRTIVALNTARLNQETLDASLEAVARAVDEIMNRHAGERGVIHTTSYRQTNYIIEHVSERNRARLSTTEGASSRSELLRAHGSTGESVLISPSLFQGVDLKDDLARFQVMVKVPFPDLSSRRIRLKKELDRGWYDWQTALRLVQTYGRGVRSPTDHAVTYVLDSNFTSFVQGHRELFPDYFLEAVSQRS